MDGERSSPTKCEACQGVGVLSKRNAFEYGENVACRACDGQGWFKSNPASVGERIDAEAVEAWRPPVADAATDDDGNNKGVRLTGCSCELGGVNDDGTRCVSCDGFGIVAITEGDIEGTRPLTHSERIKVSRDLDLLCIEPDDDLDIDDIDDCDPADDEPDFVRDWTDED